MSQKPTANPEGETKEIDVGHLAELARLAINGAANVKIADDLQAIITMIDTMQAVNTEGIEPMSHPLDTTARLRSDEVTEKPDPEHFQRGAPATADHYYLVPRVVE